tara:strand:- start:8617 stop:8760 length:144 start_codon:yes stop_codon:yes gene_type:complete
VDKGLAIAEEAMNPLAGLGMGMMMPGMPGIGTPGINPMGLTKIKSLF